MANYHGSMKTISRQGGKSCVASLAYRSASKIQDLQTGDSYDYTKKGFVEHVEILHSQDAPTWISELAQECKISKETALQKLSDIFEAAEKRKDSQVYREFEFSLPNELTDVQNIKWATEFVRNIFVDKGMIAVTNFHFDVDKKTGEKKPHCHVLLSTRTLTEDGFGQKNREWNSKNLLLEAREQYAAYQNFALKEHGFEVRVDHRSYMDRGIEIEGQPKLGGAIIDMAKRGLKLDKFETFNAVKLRNQFKILKDPELVFSIVTANHSTFTRHDVARVLNRYIDDAEQFREVHDRLLGSNNLVQLEAKEGAEPIYTTREMLRVEMGLVNAAERMSVQQTHAVSSDIVDRVITQQNEKLAEYGGLSPDQAGAIQHMLSEGQIACVVGYAGAGKTTSLKAAREAWEASGYKVVGIAPTGKAAREIEDCGIRSMTIHKFLHAQEQGREKLSAQSILVLDEAGMVDSRRFAELLAVAEKAGAKIVPMGDGNQLQSVEAGPAFRLLTERVSPAVLETIVRQREEWQREATRLFGSQQAGKALGLYLEKGAFKIVEEKRSLPGEPGPLAKGAQEVTNTKQLIDTYCLSRQMSGRIWKEMIADYEQEHGKTAFANIDYERLSQHQDYRLFDTWKNERHKAVGILVKDFEVHKEELNNRGVNIEAFSKLVEGYQNSQDNKVSSDDLKPSRELKEIDGALRQMSYSHIVDTRQTAKEELVTAWMRDRTSMPEQSHLMLSFTNKDAASLNESARKLMREEGTIKGPDFSFETHSIQKDDFGKEIITKQDRSFAVGDRLLFMRNNTSLGVKNGTLGTVSSLDKGKMVVNLDGKDNKEVSFAPKLYPYIDNGWATNIYKSQGVTVDHVKKLASFEEYRNLAYVGMSRHRHSLEIVGSSLDFWREEKVIDRLSRVQEKLSGFDYLDTKKVEELIKDDSKMLWHEQKIQEGKDLWGAIKGTSKSAVDHLLDRPKNPITVDPLQGFENSEEKRSGELFKETTTEQINQLDNDNSVPHAIVKDSSSRDTFEDRLKAVQDKINDAYEIKTVTRETFLSFEEADKQLKERMFELATDVLGNPTSRTSTQLRFGKKGSISVFTNGPKQGLYANHESGVYGGPLKLIEDQIGLASPKDSLKWASDWLGGNPLVIEQRVIEKNQNTKETTWTPIIPIPKEVENPSIVGDPYLNYMLKDGNKEVSRHAYRDEVGNLKGYVFRIEKADGGKITPPLAYCKNEKGFEAWKWKAFEKENKTPYGIEKLTQNPSKTILVVEGEKTADAAQNLLTEYNVLTWSGGAGNVSKTNWDCLAGRVVVIWPDNDSGGLKAAETLQKIVASLNTEKGLKGTAGIVPLPHDLPKKWDLADKLPEGWNVEMIKEMLRDATPQIHIEKEALPLEKAGSIVPEDTPPPQKLHRAEELEILTYLKETINIDKHSWLLEKDVLKLLKAAEVDPVHTLARWQDISGNESFKLLTPEIPLPKEQQEALDIQAKDIRSYLQDEINPEKHIWLTENTSQRLLEMAAENPLNALKEWQDKSEDYSFKPIVPEALMSKEQIAFKEKIMAYLKEEVRPEKHTLVDEEYCDKLFSMMDRDPLKSLQEWQRESRDYSFNPFREQLNDRELRVQEYIIERILDEDRPFSEQKYADVTANLLDNPLKAYQALELYTADKTFELSTGIPKIEMDAQELLTKIKDFTHADLIKGLAERLSASPESVINECNALLLRHEKNTQLESAVNKFVTLTEQFNKMAWHDPAHDETFHEIESLVEQHIENREFIRMVEVSKSSIAIEKLHDEIEERQQQHTLSR